MREGIRNSKRGVDNGVGGGEKTSILFWKKGKGKQRLESDSESMEGVLHSPVKGKGIGEAV